MLRAPFFGSLRRALATLIGHGVTIEVRQRLGHDSCSISNIVVYGAWSQQFLLDIPVQRDRALAYESAVRFFDNDIYNEDSCKFEFVIGGKEVPDTRAPTLNWVWIVKQDTMASRFALVAAEQKGPAEQNGPFEVKFYRNGLLHDVEYCNGLNGYTLYVDIHSPNLSDDTPPVPDGTGGAELPLFAHTFFRSDRAQLLAKSRIVCKLLESMLPWKLILRNMWCIVDDQQMIDIWCTPDTPDSLSQFINCKELLQQTAYRNTAINIMGLAVLRRMRPNACSRVAEWKATAISEQSVLRFKMVPLSFARFSKLHSIGAFDGITEHADQVTPYGLLWDIGDERTFLVPHDVDAALLTMAIVNVLPCEVDVAEEPPTTIELSFGAMHTESATSCIPNEELRAFRVELLPNVGIRLSLDDAIPEMFAGDSVQAIDAVLLNSVARCETRVCKALLTAVFPKVAQRIQADKNPLAACFREAQARRMAGEWTLEGLDHGSNLSSLGLSIVVAVTLATWIGAQTRVFIGLARGAMLGFWDAHKNGFQLVDCTRSLLNGFDVAPYLLRTANCEFTFDIKKQSFLEVRQRSTWHVAMVISVNRNMQTASVRLLLSGNTITLCLRQHAWRRLARSSETDIDKVLRKFLTTLATSSPTVPVNASASITSEHDEFDMPPLVATGFNCESATDRIRKRPPSSLDDIYVQNQSV